MLQKQLSESEDRQKAPFSQYLINIVSQHITPLKSEIAQERTARTQDITELRAELKEMNEKIDRLTSSSSSFGRSGNRTDEVIIGGFKKKSRQGAIHLCREILHGIEGSPTIIEDRIANIPVVVPIKFDYLGTASKFIRSHSNHNQCRGYCGGFAEN